MLEKRFPMPYRIHGLVAHECILGLRQFKSVTAEDVAKRLMDYGFQAPTPCVSIDRQSKEKIGWRNRQQ